MRVGLGPGVLMSYILQGLVHPARKVREVCYSTSFSRALSHVDILLFRCTGESTIRAI